MVRALCELNQISVFVARRSRRDRALTRDPDSRAWTTHATRENQPYLVALDGRARVIGDFERVPSGEIAEEIARCRRMLEDRGMEVIVLDQTRPDIGLPVVKVVVPGLRHFWRRLAPGRLYDVPLALGWIEQPAHESELNPISMFL